MLNKKNYLLLFLVVGMLMGCASRNGPSFSDLHDAQPSNPGLLVLPINSNVAGSRLVELPLNNVSDFLARSFPGSVKLGVGDKINIYVWESASLGLFTNAQKGVADLGIFQIADNGYITVPYVGSVLAKGNTIEGVRAIIVSRLSRKTIDPQVEIKLTQGMESKVNILGGVNKPGIYTLNSGLTTLRALIAAAGGVSAGLTDFTDITFSRGSHTIDFSLQDLLTGVVPDIPLVAGDQIQFVENSKSFTVLGAAGTQGLVKFPKNRVSLLEAIALSKGLVDDVATPQGVFLLRRERADFIRSLDSSYAYATHDEMVNVVYELNMRSPEALFASKRFEVRDGDSIFMTNSYDAGIKKALSVLLPFATAVSRF